MEVLDQLVLDAAASPWAVLAVFAFTIIDAFFPPVPSESIVVGLAAISIGTGQPALWLVGLAAALGAFIGDNVCFEIGRAIGLTRFGWMRRPRVAAALDRASREVDRRVASAVLTARYIPVGRVAVNLVAGATGVPRRVFRPLTVVSAVTWSVYSISIGTLAGPWAAKHPLLAAGAAILVAITVGILVDTLLSVRRRRRERLETGADQDTQDPASGG